MSYKKQILDILNHFLTRCPGLWETVPHIAFFLPFEDGIYRRHHPSSKLSDHWLVGSMCFHPGIACFFAASASLLLPHSLMSKMSLFMKAVRKGQCQRVICTDCGRERGHWYRSNVTNNTWGSITGGLWRERQHLRDSGQVEFSRPLGVNYKNWSNLSWCFTSFDILEHFKCLTLKGQSCCSCSCIVLPNKLRLGGSAWSLRLCPSLVGMLFLLPWEFFQLKHCLEKLGNNSDTIHFKIFWFFTQ